MIVEDMGSTNGTFCNGIKVDRRELVDGDKIMVGSSTILKFTYHDYLDEVFQRQMYESALRDGLTKVFNKKYFTDYLEKEFAFAARHGGPLALIFLDIDYFKKINDDHGHPAGDFVLAELSQMMTMLLRTEDVLARFGGEEFTILCRGSDLSGAKIVAERVRKAVEERKFSFGGKDIPVTVSLGVVAIPESGITEHNGFLAAADKALYEAKRSGRNRVCVHGSEQTPNEPRKRSRTGSGPLRSV
jgi:diguanylate cyclase (GGDEF)-like protein